MRRKQRSIETFRKSYQGWTADEKTGILVPNGISRDDLISKFKRYTVELPGAMGSLGSVKAYKPEEKLRIGGVANANVIDRMDERLEPTGVKLSSYLKNSVLLYQHNHAMPIGLVESIDVEEDGVKFEGWIGDPKCAPLTRLQEEVRSLVAQRILKAVSVGFIPLKIKYPLFNDQGNMVEPAVIEEWEMLELSIVAVPANAGSLIEMRNEENGESSRKQWTLARDLNSDTLEDKTQKEIEEMEELLKQMMTLCQSILAATKTLEEQQAAMMKVLDTMQAPGTSEEEEEEKADDEAEDKEEEEEEEEEEQTDVEKAVADLAEKANQTNARVDSMVDSLNKLTEVITSMLTAQANAA